MSHPRLSPESGPFRADQLRDGDRYELSHGHPIYCAPARREHAAPNIAGATVIDTDPDVAWAGVDAGFSPEPGTLRAPDVAVAAPTDSSPNATGWLTTAPPLAVEYAGQGQDEADLRLKIAELLEAGTCFVWVVRLRGPQRVEVYRPDGPMRLFTAGEVLEATGILRNPVPVRALFDRETAHEVVLRNLLQRRGYDSLSAVFEEGREEGREVGLEQGRQAGEAAVLLRQITLKFGPPDAAVRQRIETADVDTLLRWSERILTAQHLEEVLDHSPHE